jgi:hypothetical protein
MNLLRKIQYNQYWDIGFCEQTPEELIRDKQLKPVRWLKHPYRDRWFADPFLYKVTESEIIVFVEECPMEHPKGIICELVIDRKTMRLKERYVMLELDTHLSYPAYIHHEGKVYVYPENGMSGKLYLYEYDEVNHKLVNPVCILDEAVADATILELGGRYYMSATKYPDTQKKAYLYVADFPFESFKQIDEKPYQTELGCSRQGGNYFEAYGSTYRPAQNCEERYGGALAIMNCDFSQGVRENEILKVAPQTGRFGLGLHTLNFVDGLCVIDGFGYYMPLFGKLYFGIRKLMSK